MTLKITSTDRILALFIAAVATGVYLCTLSTCVRWLVYVDDGWRVRKQINKTWLSATLAIFFLSSLHTTLAVTTTFFNIRTLETGVIIKESDVIPWTDVVQVSVFPLEAIYDAL